MDPVDRKRRFRAFEQACRDRSVPLTVQRRAVLEAVLELDCHPTIDQVHEVVATRTPGISRTTVYRTMETLVRLGLISKACHPGSVVRYDRRTDSHHHLVCLSCDTVVDFSDERLDGLPLPDTSAQGFEVSDVRVQLRGRCRRCREQEGEP